MSSKQNIGEEISRTIEIITPSYIAFQCEQNLNKCLFLSITGMEGKTLMISVNGTYSADCGQRVSCRTIGSVLKHRAVNNDIVKIENDQFSQPFIIGSSFSFLKHITLLHGD